MATGIVPTLSPRLNINESSEPSRRTVLIVLAIALVFVFVTRWPVARTEPLESDEFGFLDQTVTLWFPMHHTLFMTFGRLLGQLSGDPYQGFILLDMLTSAGALVSVWWWLRAISRPATAAAGALVLGVGPVFWGYGAMAGNYTAIVLVGAFLLGIAYRGRSCPRAWYPYAAAVTLAIGTGYRQDIGTLWLPVFGVILWQHRWKRAIQACLLFTILNLAWLSPMLYDVGGWAHYRAVSAEYAYRCGYLNSYWNLGFINAPARYAVKLGMALLWTLGPALLFVPRGAIRLRRVDRGGFLCFLFVISVIPALTSHLLVQFGVPGWSFHYVPTLIALLAIGIGRAQNHELEPRPLAFRFRGMFYQPAARLIAIAVLLAAVFWYYPTDYAQPGWRGSFDLAFSRFTRIGLKTPMPDHAPLYWRTPNSRPIAGTSVRPPREVPAGSG
jgi:hypothetical protein